MCLTPFKSARAWRGFLSRWDGKLWARAARLCTLLKKASEEPRDLLEQLSAADVSWQGSRRGALLSLSTHGSGKGERQGLRWENRKKMCSLGVIYFCGGS